jgi:glycerol-3-phosphate dehydrogenase (NAD(P)+)
MTPQQVAVLGAGSFGTVLANIIAQNGHKVRLWGRDQEMVKQINEGHHNPKYLPDYVLHESLVAYTDLIETIADVSALFFCVPSSAYEQTASTIAPHVPGHALIVSTAKGLRQGRLQLMSELLADILPSGLSIGVLSGPNIAAELARQEITATVLASEDFKMSERIHALLYCSYLRIYNNDDKKGVELAGALKNIYAIIAGIASGLGVGYNSVALLITRALAEMRRFAMHYGAKTETFLGLAGNGDLIVTCLSPESRNFHFGKLIGSGCSVQEAIAKVGQTVEGLNTLKVIHAEATRSELYMPLMQGLHRMVYEGAEIKALLKGLMHASHREDVDDQKSMAKHQS